TGGKFATAYPFDDSDVYKIIEAASYVLMLHPDAELDKALDGWIAKIAAAQEPDGYIYTARTIDPKNTHRMSGQERWTNERDSHELYNAGHMYEAAVAHHQATGKRNFLNVALKNADFIDKTFGPGKDQLKFVPGHEVTEMGLVKLYRATGKIKYLALAKFFIDERGNADGHELYGTYNQDHKPVVEQTEAVGHAVRAAYLYAGATDVAALTGDRRYMDAMDKIWEDIVSKKLYLTGGIGAAGGIEGFGPAYDLPNPTGYAETCATIAYALWNYRMFLYYGDGKYMDLFERAAYNAFLSGYGMSGDLFFYPNPLSSHGQHARTPWFTCACCPPNVARFIAELGGFVYGVEGDKIFVNIYTQGTAELETKAGKVNFEQTTDYPWTGDIKISVNPEKAAALTLMARIPGWAQGRPLPSDLYRYAEDVKEAPAVKVNGAAVTLNLEKGYASIARTWQKGDVVEIHFPMPVRRVFANENLKADIGRVAVERGPLVFCAEGADSEGTVSNLVLDDGAVLTAEARPGLLDGVTVITGEAMAYRYKSGRLVGERQKLTLIPYYAWAHRGRGEMEVWLPRIKGLARPVPEPTTASTAKVSSSESGKGIEAIHDLYEPENSNDHAHGYLHWWPKKGTSEWVQYDFGKPAALSETSVYWFDDTGEGECRVPVSWKAFYRAGDKWVPVKSVGLYGVEKDKYNTVRFAPVGTTGLRLEIKLPEKFSAGIQEWKVK
ncbi:MAG: glycoside hydrolase family 127 protein, partial [Candidatus Aminicenantes bacterium]|nr:glycoside hydrolase family 127 protein [Candidatus Aminicenantes bacterium]